MSVRYTDRSTDSLHRVTAPTRSTSPTYVQTYKTNAEPYSPSRDISPSVTHARAYRFEVWS